MKPIVILATLLTACASSLAFAGSQSWVYECTYDQGTDLAFWAYVGKVPASQVPPHSAICRGWHRVDDYCDDVVDSNGHALSRGMYCSDIGAYAYTR